MSLTSIACHGSLPSFCAMIVAVSITGLPSLTTADEATTFTAQLRRVAAKRIYFGHQSVGGNILDGLRELSAASGVPLNLVEPGTMSAQDEPFLVDAYVGQNTLPFSKIEAFEKAMESGWAGRASVAMFKFCYVDFGPETDVRPIFERYVAMHERLKARHPGTTWIHVTVPLTGPQPGLKGIAKRALGRDGSRENAKRHEYNEFLRAKYAGREPIFDLAAIESTRDDGSVEEFDLDGKRIPSLVPEYTSDGGHLNAAGRQRAARALVGLLARLP